MFRSVLIANRGEIACRVIETAKRLGMRTIAVYSEADAHARHVALADEAHLLGPAPAAESYLKANRILDIAKRAGAEAIHPGYGFLSENAAFAEACHEAGITFVGPSPAAISAMGRKDAAKLLMEKAGVPVVPGYHGEDQDPRLLAAEAERIGYPVLIKAVAGGGGKGMRRVDSADGFPKALEGAQREAANAFGDDRVLIEKFLLKPRHIEVQVFGDSHGNVVHLFERDCSLQRRHQKVVEEAPAPGMPEALRAKMGEAAVAAAKAIAYEGAGTVEFIVDASTDLADAGFYFMEMNTRLQVEHPVTEMITGQDLVAWQLGVAAGEPLPAAQEDLSIDGHAVEVRLYAEDPQKNFLPSTGRLQRLRLSDEDGDLRIDTGVREGDEISMFYDPMIAKIIAWGDDRHEALRRLNRGLKASEVVGVKTNLALLTEVTAHEPFLGGDVHTGFFDAHLDDLLTSTDEVPAHVWAAAALTHLLLKEREEKTRAARLPDAASPWNAADGWRHLARGTAKLALEGGDGRRDIVITYPDAAARRSVPAPAFDLAIGETSHTTAGHLDDDDTVTATIDGVRLRFGVAGERKAFTLVMEAVAWAFSEVDPLSVAEAEGAGGGAVRAPMPGKIAKLTAKAGERIRRGQPLVVLEAMKMEHTLTAPADGKVGEVLVGEGDQVEEGAILVRMAEGEGA